MNLRHHRALSDRARRGVGRSDVLVVGVIIFIVTAFVLPAIHQTRVVEHTVRCLNRMRQLAQGLYNYAEDQRGRFPGHAILDHQGHPLHSWVVDVLPHIDHRDLADRWQHNNAWDSPEVVNIDDGEYSNRRLCRDVRIHSLICPNDLSRHDDSSIAGQLSYVVNAGYADLRSLHRRHDHRVAPFDWNRNGTAADQIDQIATRRSGLCWQTDHSRADSLTLDELYDGSGQTIMLTESLSAGFDTWAGPDVRNGAFVYPVEPNVRTANDFRTPQLDRQLDHPVRQRQNLSPYLPVPSSVHPGGINTVFCDGGGRFLRNAIDPHVFALLVTPAGTAALPPEIKRQESVDPCTMACQPR